MAVTWVGFSAAFVFVCLSVCFSTRVSKTNAARITRLDLEMFHYDSWKTIYFGVNDQSHEAQKNIAGVGHDTLVSAGFL